MLEVKLSSHWHLSGRWQQIFLKNLTVYWPFHFSFYPDQCSSLCCRETPHNSILPPPCVTVGMLLFGCWAVLDFRQTYRLVLRPNNSILVSSASEFSRCVLAKLSRDCMWYFLRSGFFLATLPYKPHLWRMCDIVVTCTQWPLFIINSCNCFRVADGLLVSSLISFFRLFPVYPVWSDILIQGGSVLYQIPSTS